ncbi:copper chaperone PCu(A)C [Streptomyces sp. NPDC050211]|uniref:copper chaperone PCu(A)C n=1 Tax=Streptomyces sp. NPDC050211 TaxID=3154932 RepID=UPI00343CEF88
MSSSLRRGALAAAAIAFSIASLSACAAGNNAQTLEVKPDNAATTVGDVKIQNAVVITQPDEESTGPAAIAATVFNSGNKAQTLDSITVDGAGTAKLTAPKGKSLSIPAGGSLILGGENNAAAVLTGSREALKDGDAQKVTFTFSTTGDVSLEAFVVPAESYFSSWGPTEVPAAPGGSAKPGDGASGSPTGSASPSGNATPSDAASGSATPTGSASNEAAGH